MMTQKAEDARLLRLAVDEETAALEAEMRGDDILLIDQCRRRATHYRAQVLALLSSGAQELPMAKPVLRA